MFETIVALATAPIKSALAIIRLSGDDCFFVVDKFFSKELKNITKSTILHGFIKDNEEIVDEVVLLAYKGPHSFTGEDSVEIIAHGSPLIFNKIIEVAVKNGARLALGGEFSSRSYMNNKMDLIQAESINDLINAESEESKKISMMALTGQTSTLIAPLKKSFGDILSLIEVNIDYPEYTDIEEANFEKIDEFCAENIKYIEKLIENGNKGRIIKDGIKVALVGKPNVGKSSILNALLEEDKAIVTDIKGTTRDVVEGKINLNGVVINLFDTAGIRESKDFVEQCLKYNNVKIVGLMMMAKADSSDDSLRLQFRELRELQEEIQNDLHISLPYLSMGMSNDYEDAIKAGATHIRLGRILWNL